ncbi:hypothetical protein G3O06_04975 [Burkholderia sp. Ac-20345]|uniref:hypothetical protein n=1 Tax=Burkholderia sp. Ac-20345 TaxID=2703891 RepID=UPI00197C25BD|nr:hypothetical protein [Burkholderia sp. Ac-20345]MBN3776924.1 hypothetical protein [Burkholderia sp. Ac-20345]
MVDFRAEAEHGLAPTFLSGSLQGASEVWRRICRPITRRAARRRALAFLDCVLADRRRGSDTALLVLPERNSPSNDDQMVIADFGDRPEQVPQFPSIRNAQILSMNVREEIS